MIYPHNRGREPGTVQRRYLGLDALAAARRVGEPDPDPEEVTEPDLRALTA